ncbi:hypothetical protein B0H21DRAFT_894828 [Amylocystis lapponica]|nr:hypothetical protein B0H21DRAFT_894828 [Amylocystis lapponica]
MSMVTVEERLRTLGSLIDTGSSYCCGTIPLSPDEFLLFYGKTDTARRINLAEAPHDALKDLTEACDPATFGLNQENVFDESYRKAVKLDSSTSLSSDDEERSISAELYKLNVYQKDSFFESHKDTPRRGTMFGSLVVVFPTPHEGGALVLRHNNEEWTFDSAKAISEHEDPRLAYVAFYSDVEHEVALVTSGHRVTITYNLYFAARRAGSLPEPTTDQHYVAESAFKTEFRRVLADASFLPQAGYVMFGLRHQYPVDFEAPGYPYDLHSKASLQGIKEYLKGSDALVAKVCWELGLRTSLQLLFEEDDQGFSNRDDCPLVALEQVVDLGNISGGEESFFGPLRKLYGGKRLNSWPGENDIEVLWATEIRAVNKIRRPLLAYGNEVYLGYTYAHLCLLVDIGRFNNRETINSPRRAPFRYP